ncbi:hypothetical protein A2Y83_00990 [Candidatus Falkowbacteria bacterium RBG_13_39_14]|uniref:Uncharacterized protein n=1 Tax=Candidatus Falkowbacteria bacterium RBG_13_39_14 TaxID=1797985 RepID=A0A1F5S6H9_9BACT|nr:MAG: hypothetical protein A2Y83_00990 [Candidatus Falkowbacteria bacterium RBG_13_39_14]
MKSPETGPPSPEKEGRKFYRITPEQFQVLPDGTALRRWALFDKTEEIKIKGKDEISTDTRNGFMAWGFLEEDIPAGLEVDERGMEVQEKKKDEE